MELFRKKDSRFYCYDFKVRGKRYRGSTKETNKKRVGRIAALRFSQAIEGTGLLDRKAPSPAGALDPVQKLGRISQVRARACGRGNRDREREAAGAVIHDVAAAPLYLEVHRVATGGLDGDHRP